jgi:competence protein ComEC
MPLISIAALSYIVGLLGGFQGISVALIIATSVTAWLAWREGKAATIGLLVIFLAGLLAAHSARGHVEHRARTVGRTGVLAKARAHATASVDSIFRDDAPLARALLVADEQGISVEMRARYADAGIIHMLSISGLHVAVIASAVALFFQIVGAGKTSGSIATISIIMVYVAILGAPPPALRSALMLAVGLLSRVLQRPTSPWALLAIGALVPLWDPRVVLDLGYQLTVLGMVGVYASGALTRRIVAERQGWVVHIGKELIASAVATLVTAPLIAWTFGRLSIIAPVANLAAGPLLTLAQPIMFLALILAPLESIASLFANAAHPLLIGFDKIATVAASVPYASLTVAPGALTAVGCGVAICAGVVACYSRHVIRPLALMFATLGLVVWAPIVPERSSSWAELHMIDVGQGDAIALRTPRNRWILFDAGRVWRGGDAGRTIIVPYLLRHGGDLTAFVLSHPHADHVGGAATIIRALRPQSYWEPAFVAGSDAYQASLDAARDVGVTWHRVHPADTLSLDGVRITFLAPDSTWTVGLDDPNLASTVALVQYGNVRFLLVGDAEKAEEDWLLQNAGDQLRADVLKVGHHGSSTSTSPDFLAAVSPRLALVSVGALNSYGHPNRNVMESIRARNATVIRTDSAGTIVVRTDGVRLVVRSRGVERSYDK